MKIKGAEGLSNEQLQQQIARGARFVLYQYCISIIVMTFRRSSDIQFVPAGEGRVAKGLPYSLVSFLLGWWGIPWGPIYTIGSIATNFGGGKDVTDAIMASLNPAPSIAQAPSVV